MEASLSHRRLHRHRRPLLINPIINNMVLAVVAEAEVRVLRVVTLLSLGEDGVVHVVTPLNVEEAMMDVEGTPHSLATQDAVGEHGNRIGTVE